MRFGTQGQTLCLKSIASIYAEPIIDTVSPADNLFSSEKEPGMFGTLVICLPSKHEGGEVHVTHGGQRKVLGTAESSEFKSAYLCWFVLQFHWAILR